MTVFMGMRGNGDWVTDQRPTSWREMILKLYPNGKAPLTAILSKMSKEKVDDPQFNWWTQIFQNQGGAITGSACYKSADLSTGTGLAAVAVGTVLYVKVAEAVAQYFREGHQALLRNEADYTEDCNGKVIGVVKNGASSYIIFKALQASTADPDTDFDRILVVGNINPEGGVMPVSLVSAPVKWYNYTQIWRNSLSMTRTAMQTKLRTGDQYQQAKSECLEQHSIEMEKSFLFGYPSEGVGANGKPERTTMGIMNAIRGIAHGTFPGYPDVYTEHCGTVSNFPTVHTTKTWLSGGEDWLNEQLEIIFRYGDTEKMCFCGNGVLLGLSRLVSSIGDFSFTPMTTSYGIKINQWVTPFGTLNFIAHPLFNMESSLRNTAVVFEPANLKYRFVQDTTFYAEGDQQNTGVGRIDGKNEEFLTEAGLEFYNPIGWAILTGFNTDGTAV